MAMNGSVLLDTNVVISVFSGDAGVLARLATADDVLLSSVVLGELYFGAFKSSRIASNIDRIRALTQSAAVLNCDAVTAERYGRLKEARRAKGTPIPENDLWIAACAMQYDLALVTRDSHFEHIGDLQIERW